MAVFQTYVAPFATLSIEIRCLVDVPGQKVPSIANGEMANYLKIVVAPQVPPEIYDSFVAAVDKGNIRTMPNRSMSTSQCQVLLQLIHLFLQLEEFRKKKAAKKAKKATSTSQTNVSNVSLNEKQQLKYLVVSLNEKLCSIYLSKLIVANENILEKKHDFYSTK
ncbi:hypothetical protein J1N35_040158 [Gossypium stocksii]|uniref:Squalene monooxygenase n=1 Tax=Gossypium stocksii TaxID=47602 RepID=A0A9D3UD53_9ROSI|nr:hypothetical protein J1N35_040158 [Gossypium stocksii]